MKLKLITLIISIAIATSYAYIGIGVKGGLSLYRVSDNSFDLYNEFRPASDFSIFCELGSHKFLSHNIMLTYYQAGGKTTNQITDQNGDPTGSDWWIAEKLDYIGIGYGLNFKMQLLRILPYLSAGVSLDYLVRSKEEMGSDKTVDEIEGIDYSKLKKFNIRPFLVGGLEYKISRIAILTEYTFSYNVLPFYVEEKTTTFNESKYKTFGHFINLGCKLYL
ncbi:MAG: outer membrane beta-barrel protein [Bacillota bacterium]|nr:outer membrane beta-barrel protein [Bacillota bacterium]